MTEPTDQAERARKNLLDTIHALRDGILSDQEGVHAVHEICGALQAMLTVELGEKLARADRVSSLFVEANGACYELLKAAQLPGETMLVDTLTRIVNHRAELRKAVSMGLDWILDLNPKARTSAVWEAMEKALKATP